MCLQALVLLVFIVCYGIAKYIREKTRGSVMCRYLMANDLIYDRINTLYNKRPPDAITFKKILELGAFLQKYCFYSLFL